MHRRPQNLRQTTGAVFPRNRNQSAALNAIPIGTATLKLTVCHPKALCMIPDENAAHATTPKMQKSFVPCTLARSSGRQDVVSKVVPPINMKFQPTPNAANANQKLASSTPDKLMAIHDIIRRAPVRIMLSVPNRWIK